MTIISLFSGGISSFVNTWLAQREYDSDLTIVYNETGSHHPDMGTFINRSEDFFRQDIIRLNSRYKDHWDVIERTRFVNGRYGARCTTELKKRPFQKFCYEHNVSKLIWGFNKGEEGRLTEKIGLYNSYQHESFLVKKGWTKKDVKGIFSLGFSNMPIPKMYLEGFPNNNCIGCVKGGMGYWNHIRKLYPEVFNRMLELELEIGHSCLTVKKNKKKFPAIFKRLKTK